MRKIIAQPKDLIATFVARRVGEPDGWLNFSALALLGDRGLIAGVVYSHWTRFDVCASLAVDGRLTPRYLFAIFDYPFTQVGVRRITAPIRESNLRSIRLAEHLGFRCEGLLRCAAGTESVLLYGILKEECRWLAPRKERVYEQA